MARTQMRLDAITGSVAQINSGSMTKVAAASAAAADLQDVLSHFAGAINRIHGATDFTDQDAGKFVHGTSQFIGILSASSHIQGAAGLEIAGNTDLKAYARIRGTAKIDTLYGGDGALVFQNADKELNSNGGVAFNPLDGLHVAKTMFAGTGSIATNLSVGGNAVITGNASAVNGTFSGNVSAVDGTFTGDIAAVDAVLSGDLSAVDGSFSGNVAAVSGTFSGDLSIAGNLLVSGDTVTVNVSEMLVEDKDIVVAKNGTNAAALDGAGIKVGNGGTYAALSWSETNSKWTASEQLYSPVLQSDVASALFLKSDADGDIVAGTGADLGVAMMDQLVEGTGVQISEAAGAITIAIGQAVATTSAVTFAAVTGSNLTASRLMASNAAQGMVSADLYAWVDGTANQVSVTNDNDGSITLSLPQSIHTDADVEFDTLKLGDYAADAGKAYMVGASGSIVPAAWNQFVSIESGVGLELIQDGFKAQIGLDQSIASGSSPTFAGMTLSGLANNWLVKSNAGALQNVGLIDFVAGTQYQVNVASGSAGDIVLSLPIGLTDASNGALVGFTATSVVGALNELAAGSGGGKGKWAEMLASDINNGAFTFASGPDWSAGGFNTARVDIYLNGQMMKETADYALSGAKTVTFTFALKADDVVTAVIR